MRGRSQKTNAQRALTGGKILNIPQPKKAKVFRCPGWMPEHGAALWRRVAPELLRLKILSELDRGNFESLCLAYHLMRQAALEIAEGGSSVPDGRGAEKKTPAFTVYKANAELYKKLSDSFGLNPSSRQRLDIDTGDDDLDLDTFLNKGIE
jgi:P27 family predicted phage terminase small subunit